MTATFSLDAFETDAKRAVVAAQQAARAAGADGIGIAHLLCGALEAAGTAAARLAELGVTAELARSRVGANSDRATLPPMSRREARELRAQLRARGLGPAKAEAFVERIRRQRDTGPVAFDDEARALLESCAADGVTSATGILRRVLDQPGAEARALAEAAGTSVETVRRALDEPGS